MNRRNPASRPGVFAISLALLLIAAAAAQDGSAVASRAEEAPAGSALHLAAGSTASRELVAVGRDLVVAGDARADAVAVAGSILVSGRVAGDVIVLDGDARLAATAVVEGDAYVLGGRLDVAPGAVLRGRGAAYPTVAASLLTLLEGPAVGVDPLSPVVVGVKLGLLAAWLVATLIALAVTGGAVLATSQRIAREPLRDFLTGLTTVLTFAIIALFVASFAPPVISVPFLALLALLAVVLKTFGLVALFHRFGEWVARRLRGRRPQPVHAALIGVLLLGGVKLLPWVGIWIWTALSLVAVGATLRALLARREPELGPADLERLASIAR
ncbi:MAG: polymer-forming cytoskeletal protein [Thermoanaerobaculia bacterium]